MTRLQTVEPMLATTGPLPPGQVRWEPKVGWRSQVILDGEEGRLQLVTRSGRRIEGAVPELLELLADVGERRMVLDGEVVAGDGSPKSFYRLGPRLAASRGHVLERARRREPLTLVIFDLLWLDSEALVDRPYLERRSCLETLNLRGPHWMIIPSYEDGDALLAACEEVGVEGGVAKAIDSRYRSGRSRRMGDYVQTFE